MNKDELQLKSWNTASQYSAESGYWLNKFSGDITKTSFPYDHDISTLSSTPNKKHSLFFQFGKELSLKLLELGKNLDHRLYIILASYLVVLLHKYTMHHDIIFGSPIFKQDREGDFINTVLPLRTQFEENITFKELLLNRVRQTIVEANEHQNYPIESLLFQLGMAFSENEFPLFDVVLLLRNIHEKKYIEHTHPNILFSFIRTQEETVEGELEYNASLYDENTMARLIRHFENLVAATVFNVDIPLFKMAILGEDEKKRLLEDFNNTDVGFPYGKTINKWFEEQVELTPEKNAAVGSFQGLPQTLSYRDLNEKANRLAGLLRQKGAKAGGIIGIMLEPSVEIPVSILAVLKAGSAYLPIEPEMPDKRIVSMLEDSRASILVTMGKVLEKRNSTTFQTLQLEHVKAHVTSPRAQIANLDALPFPDRSLVNYEKYHRYIGHAMVKNYVSIQATRGCPFKCAYCHKIWPKKNIARSAANIYAELKLLYDAGIRRFAFTDDIFNLNIKNSREFFELVIKNKLAVQLFFPNGMRADLMTRDYIDLMAEAGLTTIGLALETASPRLQKLIGKNLNIEKLRDNLEYLCQKYPHIITELFTMHGFPTETKEEAMMTLDFIKSIKWIHFPIASILKIYPNTDMERLAIENGISREAITRSDHLGGHELPDTLPFDKSFTLNYKSDFFHQYFISKERLLHVIPYQLKMMSEDEFAQKYDSFFPTDIRNLDDFLNFVGITREEMGVTEFNRDERYVPDVNARLKKAFAQTEPAENALKVLLFDLSQYFTAEANILYNVVEAPLGLIYLLSYLKQQFGDKVTGKIAKARIDFDNYAELNAILTEFKPDIIGIRTLNFYKNFFHKTVAMMRSWGITVPIVAGGPYGTSDYASILQDKNVDLVVLGEGEFTFAELIGKMIANGKKLPEENILKEIPGIAFIPQRDKLKSGYILEKIMLDVQMEWLSAESTQNPEPVNKPEDPVYAVFTSGSSGKPKGVLIKNESLVNYVNWFSKTSRLTTADKALLTSSFSFDLGYTSLFPPFVNGSEFHIIPKDNYLLARELLHYIKQNKITYLKVTPSLLGIIVNDPAFSREKCASLRLLVIGGEKINITDVERFHTILPGVDVINHYGPTEATVGAVARYIDFQQFEIFRKHPTIGRPIDNMNVLILGAGQELLPQGVPGELCISGVGLAQGYLNNPELTAEKFNFNRSYWSYRSYILYKTGDLARWLPEGSIEFLGRLDSQVKIRGYRIEPKEIEITLKKYPGVREAVVISKGEAGSEKILIACVAGDKHYLPIIDGIKRYKLPNNMAIAHLNPNETDYIYEEIFIRQAYMQHGITFNDGACIFDVGANVGMFTLFANTVCKKPVIFAFEPNPEIFHLLKMNSTLYGTDVRLFNSGLSNEKKADMFTFFEGFSLLSGLYTDLEQEKKLLKTYLANQLKSGIEGMGELVDNADELLEHHFKTKSFQVQLETLSHIIETENIHEIDLLKINVEKAELDVLNGIHKDHWDKIRQIVLEVDTEENLQIIVSLLEQKGYEFVVEQNQFLKGTHLFYIYAIRPSAKGNIIKESPGFIFPLSEHKDQLLTENKLKDFLSRQLPPYMIPSHIMLLETIPLTPNGKADQKALSSAEMVLENAGYIAPGTEIEKKLSAIWSEVLGIDKNQVSIEDDFFELGGHSLKVTTMVSKIHNEMNITLPLSEIFKTPTIKELAEYIHKMESREAIHMGHDENLVPLKISGASQGNNNLFFIHNGSGEVDAYGELCNHLGNNFNYWGIKADRHADCAPHNLDISGIALTYIRKIKKIQPQGPYSIAGWCYGGTIAFEMISLLEKMKEEINFFIIVDSPPPLANISDTIKEFTLESELQLLLPLLPGKKDETSLKNAESVGRLWANLIDYVETGYIEETSYRKIIPEELSIGIPNYEYLNVRDLIYYINMIRSAERARNQYRPMGKINSQGHFLGAIKSDESFQINWGNYFEKPLNIKKVQGDHYSIFQKPDVVALADTLNRILIG